MAKWYEPRAAAELAFFRSFVDEYEHADVLRVVLARAARSARRTTHFDLDFPREPQVGKYWCHKHKKVCRPVAGAEHFTSSTRSTRCGASVSSHVCARGRRRSCSTATRRSSTWPGRSTAWSRRRVPGLIDYHEQHRYAYELLGLDDRRELELGPAERGVNAKAIRDYVEVPPRSRTCARRYGGGRRS